MLDLVLLHPEIPSRVYGAIPHGQNAIETPIWCGNLATYVRNHGFEVAIVDMAAENLTVEEVAKTINGLHPRLTAAVIYSKQPSASTHNVTVAGEVLRQVDGLTMMIGGHPSALPERTLQEEKCTYVAIGEGAETLRRWLEGVKLEKIPGLAFLEESQCIKTAPSALLSDLDESFPMPAWDLLPMGQFRAYNWMSWGYPSRQPYAAFYGSLGCWAACEFCAVQSPFYAGQKVAGLTKNLRRTWSPERIGQTLEHLATQYGITHVRIADEMFLSGRRWVNTICDEIIQRGLTLNLYVYARADTCQDRPLLEKMKKAGFRWLCLGFESSSEATRKLVGKNYSNDVVKNAVQNLHEAGINLLANYIVGLRNETIADMENTLQEAMEMQPEFFNIYCATPYPGSPLFTRAVQENWPLPKKWEDYSQFSKNFTPHGTETISPKEVVKFRDEAFKRFLSNPAYQAKVERQFGVAAKEDVQRMAGAKQERVHV